MTYKIVFFDIDGTLKDYHENSISKSTKVAISELKRKGIKLVAATGRPLSMCDEIRDLGIELFVTSNGGYVTHGKEVIHKVPLDSVILQEVMAFAQTEKHALSFYTEELTMTDVRDPRILAALKETLSLHEYPMVNPLIHEKEVFLLCLFADEEMTDKYIQQFPHLTFHRWHPYIVNVLDREVSKSAAIESVLDNFGLDPSEAIAFGDGNNDIDMLEVVGLGIAMGNGSDRLKAAADFVTKTAADGGIEYALREFQII
ncbi:Cof-type HAD-IIB family hydrolase [Planococcus sp. CP5-4]|uniref:Cof-type HAD-IIB family hydrolase n=1 Tax=unclassified Planococcus (in: firmicutes) TaxID=2662419 RepID=UPI001C21C879|nr:MULTISPECIES: Cof-type HAD-IIB family hydrolase [unclassified Planococcus (in: firmicutes)]MBU9675214.1 Cof-type HAD-IIB family hydrolase [Planococcus sp. CP5-4_YE]MBV0910731.1 Cof-type HAD-IIB family hydrolase [Planococcus sp. CP5-4_UN]MBW6063812.1 Cof-type HAD-IIB family hydrolase [Planococcus sp. CP5-4]MDE0584027.1 Cof-type HAD-IIB family hydrolase [Planococcus sp. A6]